MSQKKRVLMICLGNICRSPIAEAVFDSEIGKRGLRNHWEVESAALIGYHTGKKPDHRALSTLKENGITNYSHRARPIKQNDFENFDWIFGMDNDNMIELNNLKPRACRAKVELLGSYDPSGEVIIRDPYYDSGNTGFQKAYEQCLRSVTAFLNKHAN
ncbi:PREDICTED: low molecular weight phosphotyrosine protein phosphatase-like [Dinoponera quadriceps]|uniref:Low molecular weight phosphotyrosine protein phosphatase n=1 Tax=Dinoponera quadriceps TaxID=609295 RepID=A0A6P3X8S7_DINQU|nr:PREDICTED: low molecular weight phosphotyrosine protein phosphatase-like [Dinoponera quadriceps]XP_014474631.1 PREDICTED: low molecular weight phosphotyrosine protein phosphatase-like [Dinoponera quadriceps]XP_014474632.1 PREDICTED: low molecular weight phosphotyrosine protein phosphatase-like [Dinoponera quadriceps]XP_014474633.1 PREDICTED: low molecular weight phosphotyrosine protein phosphatase-like [Dinoponera quadriceps]